ncbi:hypothetical protein ACXR2T_10010 [Leucobacter sp. HY1910]
MSNMKRQAAGAKQAGVSVGGQFAASQKTEASGAGLLAPLAHEPAEGVVVSEPFTVKWTERNVLPSPRHRKPRDIERRFEMDAEVRSVAREDTGEAFQMSEFISGSGNLDFEVRHYDGELYRPMVAGDIWSYTNTTMEPPYLNATDRLEATPERIRDQLTRLERNWDEGGYEYEYVTSPYQEGDDSEEGAREMVQAEIDGYLAIDGELWQKTEEPTYYVSTFGMGGNHGSTALFLSAKHTPSGDNLNRKDNVFTLDEFEEAKAYALGVARGRGDTDSIRSIENHQPIAVPRDRPWRHPVSAERLSGRSREYIGDDLASNERALTDLKSRIKQIDGAVYTDDEGRQRVDFSRFTDSVQSDYKALNKRIRSLRVPLDDEF